MIRVLKKAMRASGRFLRGLFRLPTKPKRSEQIRQALRLTEEELAEIDSRLAECDRPSDGQRAS